MSVELREEAGGRILTIELSENLARDDYRRLASAVQDDILQRGKVRVLVRMHHFHGRSAGTLWEGIKLDLAQCDEIERLAFVGDRRWEASMAHCCKPFTSATVRYFDEAHADAARDWIEEGIAQPV